MIARLTGRPGAVEHVPDTNTVVTVMTSEAPKPMPKGVPETPRAPRLFVLYIAARQWKRVAESVAAGAEIVVEGPLRVDPETQTFALFVQSLQSRPAKEPVPWTDATPPSD